MLHAHIMTLMLFKVMVMITQYHIGNFKLSDGDQSIDGDQAWTCVCV